MYLFHHIFSTLLQVAGWYKNLYEIMNFSFIHFKGIPGFGFIFLSLIVSLLCLLLSD